MGEDFYPTKETIMTDILVLDWMEEFEALTESELHTYSTEQENNHEVMLALYDIFAEPYRYKGKNLLDSVCKQLLDFYRSGEEQLKKFAMQYIPILAFLHLTDKSITSIQTLLVSLYNLEVVDSNGTPRTISFRVPSIVHPSIYHGTDKLEQAFLYGSAARRYEEWNTKMVSWGPLPHVENINAQNRQRVITALIFLYNRQIANVLMQGIEHCCRSISRFVLQGFSQHGASARSSVNSDSSYNQGTLPRIPVSSTLLLELIHLVYHGAVRGTVGASQALHDLLQRATYEIYPEVLLAGNAVKNLLQNSSTISVTPRPSHSHIISKSMITNASFRTKKLPDDIPIQEDQQPTSDATLDSITEEQDQQESDKAKQHRSSTTVSALKHLPKLPGLGKKHKTKVDKQQQQQQQQGNNVNSSEQLEMMTNSNSDVTVTELPTNEIIMNHTVHVSAV